MNRRRVKQYEEFLRAKAQLTTANGFEVKPEELHPSLLEVA